MYKINQSVCISQDLNEDLMITNRSTIEIETDYHGDLHLLDASRVVLRGDLFGGVNASGNSVVEYYGTIHNGITTFGDSKKRPFDKPMCLSAYIIADSMEHSAESKKIHRKLESGEITPPLYQPNKM